MYTAFMENLNGLDSFSTEGDKYWRANASFYEFYIKKSSITKWSGIEVNNSNFYWLIYCLFSVSWK